MLVILQSQFGLSSNCLTSSLSSTGLFRFLQRNLVAIINIFYPAVFLVVNTQRLHQYTCFDLKQCKQIPRPKRPFTSSLVMFMNSYRHSLKTQAILSDIVLCKSSRIPRFRPIPLAAFSRILSKFLPKPFPLFQDFSWTSF